MGTSSSAQSQQSQKLPVLNATPGHLIRCSQQVHVNLWTRQVGAEPTSVQFGVLLVVGQHPGIDQRTLCQLMSLDKSTGADVVGRLLLRGLLTRRRDDVDGRRKLVDLTRRGRRMIETCMPAVVQVQTDLWAPLNRRDGDSLLGLLGKVALANSTSRSAAPLAKPGESLPLSAHQPSIQLQTTPGHLIRRAEQVHTNLWNDLVSAELTSVQYNTLLVLFNEPAIDQRTLGEHASLDKSTAGDVTSRLVRRGYIVSQQDQADARRKLLTLSALGRQVLFDYAEGVLEVQSELLRPLTAAQGRRFVALMSRIVRGPDGGSIRR